MDNEAESLIARIAEYILVVTRKSVTDDMRNNATGYCDYVDQRTRQFAYLLDSEPKDLSAIRSRISHCPDIQSYGWIHAVLTINFSAICSIVLEEYPVPAVVHLYLLGRLCCRFSKLEEMDDLCANPVLSQALFWNGTPTTGDEWVNSVEKWVLGSNERATHIFKKRAHDRVLHQLAQNGVRLDSDLKGFLVSDQKKRGHETPEESTMWQRLRSRIKTEVSVPDPTVLRECADRQPGLLSAIQRKVFDEASAKILQSFVQEWNTEKLKSWAPGNSM